MSKTAQKTNGSTPAAPPKKKRTYVRQTDVPSVSVEDSLRIAQALSEQYGKQPTRPIDVATAVQLAPGAGPFKTLTGASIAYGFTEGGYHAEYISLTDLGRRVVAPTEEGDDLEAKREAFLRPRVINEFMTKYDGSPLPLASIAQNVLEQMGVAGEQTERTLGVILNGAAHLGLLVEINGKQYVNVKANAPAALTVATEDEAEDAEAEGEEEEEASPAPALPAPPLDDAPVTPPDLTINNRVFITHGRNKKIVDQVKELLVYGKFEPVVSVEKDTVSKPVPDKVLDDMRGCGAAVIHVGTESKLVDANGDEHRVINSNVLIEIGAAMALYGRNFILLVEKGTEMPSNLQGLYEVRYEGDGLDHEATMKLLKSFNDFQK